MIPVDGSDASADAVKWVVKELTHQTYPQLNRVCIIHCVPKIAGMGFPLILAHTGYSLSSSVGASEYALTREYQDAKSEIETALLKFREIFEELGVRWHCLCLCRFSASTVLSLSLPSLSLLSL